MVCWAVCCCVPQLLMLGCQDVVSGQQQAWGDFPTMWGMFVCMLGGKYVSTMPKSQSCYCVAVWLLLGCYTVFTKLHRICATEMSTNNHQQCSERHPCRCIQRITCRLTTMQ